jgi:hypothetical protein
MSSVILANWEAEVGRIVVWSQAGQIIYKTHLQNIHNKINWRHGSSSRVLTLSSTPGNTKKKKKKKSSNKAPGFNFEHLKKQTRKMTKEEKDKWFMGITDKDHSRKRVEIINKPMKWSKIGGELLYSQLLGSLRQENLLSPGVQGQFGQSR